MLRLLITTAAAALVSSVAAHAADLPPPGMEDATTAITAYDWSGVYIGGNGGWGYGDSEQHNNLGVRTGNFDIDGFVGGGQIGYNWQWNIFVLGAEADFQFSDVDGSTNNAVCAGTCRTDINWFGTARARVGVAFDRVFLYGTGGLAYGEVEASCCGGAFNVTDTNVGWAAGGGVEYGLTKNFTIKGEYIVIDLDDVSQNLGGGVKVTADVDHTSIVRGGFNWKFGGP